VGGQYRLPRPTRWALGVAIFILVSLTLSIPALRDPLLRSVTAEQASFQVLEGHSRLPLPTLDGTLTSVWRTFPSAIRNGLFEPLPGSGGQPLYLAFSIELIFIWGIVILAAVRSFRPSPLDRNPTSPARNLAFATACLLFALAGMLTIGFFVPFAGTIIRYRSIYLPFLLAPALHNLRHLPVIQSLNRWLSHRL
jgi:hypothetical protein